MILEARFLRKPFVAVARVVDQYVDQADLALHLVHRGRDRVLIAHVEEDAVRTTGDIGRERGAGGLVPQRADHLVAGPQGGLGDRPADRTASQ